MPSVAKPGTPTLQSRDSYTRLHSDRSPCRDRRHRSVDRGSQTLRSAYCNALTSVAVQFPAVPGSLMANDILGTGIAIAFDQAGPQNGNPFVGVKTNAPGPSVYPVLFSPAPQPFGGDNYRLTGGRYSGSTLFLDVEEETNNPDPFPLAVQVSGNHLEVAAASQVPSRGTPVSVALAAIGFLSFRSRRWPFRTTTPVNAGSLCTASFQRW